MIFPESVGRQFADMPARHKELSVIASLDDDPAEPNQRLLDLVVDVLPRTCKTTLPIFDGRASAEPRWFDTWPGEHYRLLAALVKTLHASTVIEIGTFTAMGTVAILQGLRPDGRIVTFDLLPWNSFEQTWLEERDFAEQRVSQVLADVSAPGGIEPYRALFEAADFIFIDGPKDGATEARILNNLATLTLRRDPIIFFDDIRVMNMVGIWRRVARPKFDITSLGHWSGSGLIDWNGV
ncbi:hypothetical protein BH11PSE13_BH11PSE13_16640 [soil metagenome]